MIGPVSGEIERVQAWAAASAWAPVLYLRDRDASVGQVDHEFDAKNRTYMRRNSPFGNKGAPISAQRIGGQRSLSRQGCMMGDHTFLEVILFAQRSETARSPLQNHEHRESEMGAYDEKENYS